MKKVISMVIAAFMAITVIVPMTTVESNAAFKVRTSMPSYSSAEGKAYYYTDKNVFYKNNYGPNKKYLKSRGGYVTGNCTWYAYARASEILGKPLNTNFRWGANNWYSTNKKGNYYPYGSKPKVGAIACYSNHVAIVEKVVNGKVYVSESGWTVSKKCPTSASKLKFHYGTPWKSKAKGYIYITDSISIDSEDVNYKVSIKAKDLNLRAGPGTSYSRMGYAKPGTYNIIEKCGNWGKIKENGYWVYLSYTTKVEEKEENVEAEDTGNNEAGEEAVTTPAPAPAPEQAAPTTYNVKITASSLNMRTGPSTSYKSKGTLKKNTVCEIKAEKNGWGQLTSNGYWVKLSYTKKVETASSSEYKVKVKAKDLNMRTGPGTSYKRKGYIKPGTYVITKTSNGWGKLETNGYWIKLSYTSKI
ncbi:MAG: SH3 domain-containing protein [Bacillota bacterium]|nr:SH3 domain-containing protein [Bacillota bacterium]